jgi:streptomycin 6-kinase
VRVLEADVERGALLLERLTPGTPLSEVEDDASAMSIAAGVMRRLHRPLPERHPFPSIATLAADLDALRPMFGARAGPIPVRLVDEAKALFADLIASQGDVVLLHGDLHHDNILRSQRDDWLAIDPKGVAGERAYETGALLRNPAALLRQPAPERILARRIDQLSSELDLNRQRVRGWALAQAVLAAAWGVQDTGEPWAQGLAFAELLASLRP